MTFILFSDSSTAVNLRPSKTYTDETRRIGSDWQAVNGKKYRYTWGDYRHWNFSLEFVSSSDITQINSWWYNNEKLLLKAESDTQVFSVQIVGDKEPVSQFIMPRRDLFRGAIVLETY